MYLLLSSWGASAPQQRGPPWFSEVGFSNSSSLAGTRAPSRKGWFPRSGRRVSPCAWDTVFWQRASSLQRFMRMGRPQVEKHSLNKEFDIRKNNDWSWLKKTHWIEETPYSVIIIIQKKKKRQEEKKDPYLSSFEVAMKLTPYLKQIWQRKTVSIYPDFSEALNRLQWEGKAQFYRRTRHDRRKR